jgi:hypothetical protein
VQPAFSRITLQAFTDPPPPVPGPFAFGGVAPPGAYTCSAFRHAVNKAGDLVNYFTVESQDLPIPNAADHPVLLVPLHTLPSASSRATAPRA